MPRASLPTLALTLSFVVLVLAPPAGAATVVTIGSGTQPGVAIDPAGTAYIAWIGNESNTTSLHFCRLPRGASACAVNGALGVPGTSLSRPYVIVDGTTVRVLSYRYGLTGPTFSAVYMLTSTDGGATFDAGTQIASVNFYDAVRGPGGGVSLIDGGGNSNYERAPLDGSGPVLTPASLSADHPYNPSVALLDASSVLAVFTSAASEAQYRVYPGSGDPNDVANWTPAQTFAPHADYPRLASGPAGTFVLDTDTNGELEVRRFGGAAAGFGAPVALPKPAHPLTGGSDDMTQDAAGRLHVIWPFGDAQGQHVGYATSDDGSKWASTSFDVGNPTDVAEVADHMHLAVAADHLGVGVWSTPGSTGMVRAVAVGPAAAVPPPVVGKTANAAPLSGKVFVKLPKGASPRAYGLGPAQSNGFVPLTGAIQVPLGSTFDTTKGHVQVTTAVGVAKPGKTQKGEFYSGVFQVAQTGGKKNPITQLTLNGALTCVKGKARRCRRALTPALGRWQGALPHPRAQLCRDGARDALAYEGHVFVDDDAGGAGDGRSARLGQAQERRRAGRALVRGARPPAVTARAVRCGSPS